MPDTKPAAGPSAPEHPTAQRLPSETLTLWSSAVRPGADSAQTVSAKPQATLTGTRLNLNLKHVREAGQHANADSATENRTPDFELIRILGEGGMGLVYLARQTSIDRQIALKMLRPDRSGDEACRKALLDEAAITGHLDHPNIVPVHDLGCDDRNRLFYVMKEVKGQRWSETLQHKSRRENLDIFLRVSDAIAFAHTRGVIHRDIKPGNIMLGDFGEVIVMDWGLACSAGTDSPASRISQDTALCGTPAYMAPEMALADIARIGKTSDIYLLGAMLYEIVTGHPPRSERDPLACLLQAAENRIEPSDRDDELVEIALKAMRALPEERYGSVKELQNAVREYQSHAESITLSDRARADLDLARQRNQYELFSRSVFGFSEALARWPGNTRAANGLVETRKTYAECALSRGDLELALSALAEDGSLAGLRDRVAAAIRERDSRQQRMRALKRTSAVLAASVVLSLVAGFILVKRQRDRALIAETRQAEARRQAENLIDFMTFDLRVKLSGLGRLSLLDDINQAVEAYHRRHDAEMDFAGKKLTDSELRRRSASQHSIGDVLRAQGNPKDALSAYREALKAYVTMAERAPGKTGAQRDLSVSHIKIGAVLRELGCLRDALDEYRKAQFILERVTGNTPGDSGSRRDLALNHIKIGEVLRELGKLGEALTSFRKAYSLLEQLKAASPKNAAWLSDLAYSHNCIGDALRELGSLGESLQAHRQALAVREKLARDDPRNADLQSGLAACHANIGEILLELGRHEDALATFRQAFGIRERLARSDPENALWQSDLSVSQINIGDTLCALGKPDEALEAYRLAMSVRVRMANSDPDNKVWQRELAVNSIRLGDAMLAQSQNAPALEEYRKATEVLGQLAVSDPDNAGWQRDLSTGHIKIAAVLRDNLNLENALAEYRTAQSILERLANIDPGNALWQRDLSVIHINIGDILRLQEKPGEALTAYCQALAFRERLADSDPANTGWQSDLAVAYFKVGNAYSALGRLAEALTAYGKARAIRERLTQTNPVHTGWKRGLTLCQERIAEIEARLRQPKD